MGDGSVLYVGRRRDGMMDVFGEGLERDMRHRPFLSRIPSLVCVLNPGSMSFCLADHSFQLRHSCPRKLMNASIYYPYAAES